MRSYLSIFSVVFVMALALFAGQAYSAEKRPPGEKTVTGTVTAIDASAMQITIDDKDQYLMALGYELTDDKGNARQFGELRPGTPVMMIINANNQVKRIWAGIPPAQR